jgi:diguanylate cyclase (GGDEF)-like protein
VVARFDRDARYCTPTSARSVVAPLQIIGRTLRELRGEEQYAQLQPHIEAVLRGESPVFDTFLQLAPDERVELRAQFVPDRAADGGVQGFYSLAFDVSEAKRHERALEALARFDFPHRLANRRHFEEALAEAVALSVRTAAPLALLALDLDRFKQINDTLGHAAGDEVSRSSRGAYPPTVYDVDLVARMGGDEFLVLVRYAPTRDATEKIATHIVEAMRAPFMIEAARCRSPPASASGWQRE